MKDINKNILAEQLEEIKCLLINTINNNDKLNENVTKLLKENLKLEKEVNKLGKEVNVIKMKLKNQEKK